ncbi:hypothetical protein [Herbiconiux sp. A18JL235]|uniref:Uncharacterized protein n=1 Tax=Herbiconiux sp. A18JL235 TaxID=3152363 RepID=A0AB39BC22_9MICO
MTGMFRWVYEVSGTIDGAQQAVDEVLASEEYVVDKRSTTEWHATLGTEPSFLQKMFTNADEPVILTVTFADTGAGVEVELKRPTLYGVSGTGHGEVALAHLDKKYRATARAVHDQLAGAGILLSSRE